MGKVTEQQDKRLVAYSVQGSENGCIVFASNSASARRQGAGELGCDWEDIESCRRAQWADEYVNEPRVPPLVMIEHGWWFECCHCGCHIDSDQEGYDDDNEARELDPVEEGGLVFCTPACRDAEAKERADKQARKEAARNAVLEKFPGVEVKWTDDSEPAKVSFTFPGGKYGAIWTVGDELVSISQCDLDAWNAYRAPFRAAEKSA